jgi:hypothetical protein
MLAPSPGFRHARRMAKLRGIMQPLPGLLRAGGGAAAVRVTVSPYGARLVVRSADDVFGVPMARLRRDSTIPVRPTLYRSDAADWSLVVENVTEDSWVNDIRGPLAFPLGFDGG